MISAAVNPPPFRPPAFPPFRRNLSTFYSALILALHNTGAAVSRALEVPERADGSQRREGPHGLVSEESFASRDAKKKTLVVGRCKRCHFPVQEGER